MNSSLRSFASALLAWSFAALFYFYESLLQTSPSSMISALMEGFQINRQEVGQLTAAYGLAYACVQIPAGILMDKIGPRKLLTFGCLLCSFGSFCFLNTSSLSVAWMIRFFMGIGGGFAVVGCMKVARLSFEKSYFGFLAGLMVAIGMSGMSAGQKPITLYLSRGYPPQKIFQTLGISGCILAIFLWCFIKEVPNLSHSVTNSLKKEFSNLCSQLLCVSRSLQTWYLALFAAWMFVPTPAFAGIWGMSYWQHLLKIEPSAAANYNAFLFLGWSLGGPILGALSDVYQKRKPFLFLGSIFSTGLMMLLLYTPPTSQLILFSALFGLGFFSSSLMLSFSLACELNPAQLTGTVVGFVNTCNTLVWALLVPVIGKRLDMFKGDLNPAAYVYSFQPIVICLALAVGTVFLIKETPRKMIKGS